MTRSPGTHGRAGVGRSLRVVFLAGAVALTLGLRPQPAEGQVVMGWLFDHFLATPTFNVGFDIGMSLSTLSGLENAERRNSTLFGLIGEWRFHPHLHLQPGFTPISQEGAQNIVPIPFDDPQLDPLVTGTMTRKMNMLDFFVLLQYATGPDKGLRVGVGPQFNIITSAVDRYEGLTSAGTSVVIEQDLENRLKNYEAGVVFDIEYQIIPSLGIGVRYFHGLTDFDDTPGFTVKSRVLSGSGRILLGRSRPSDENTSRSDRR